MTLKNAYKGMIFEIININLSQKMIERLNSINIRIGLFYIIDNFNDQKHIEFFIYDKINNIKISTFKLILSFHFLDKFEIKNIENKNFE